MADNTLSKDEAIQRL